MQLLLHFCPPPIQFELDQSTPLAYNLRAPLAYRRNQSQGAAWNGRLLRDTRVHPRVTELLSDDEYAELQKVLVADPNAGDLIPGSGGLRKIRWAIQGRGKRSGARIIYYHLISRDQFYMLLIYGKNEQDDLSPEQLRVLKKAVEAIWQ